MADKRISQLNSHTSPTGSDLLVIVNNNETKKITYADLKDSIVINSDNTILNDFSASYLIDSASFYSQILAATNEQSFNGLISGSSQLTSSYDSRYVLSGSITQTTWDNIENKPNGIVSSSQQITDLGFISTSVDIADFTFTSETISNNNITLDATNTLTLHSQNGDIILNADGNIYKGSVGAGRGLVTDGYLDSVIGDTNTVNNGTGHTITDNLNNIINSIPSVNSLNAFTSSLNGVISGSNQITNLGFATTGSNTFIGTQIIQTPSPGIPNGVSNWVGQGGWNQGFYSNLATTGGTGTGLTVDVAAAGGGYINISAISINTPGIGYTNGDVITINNENNLPGEFTIGVETGSDWIFDSNGSLTTPGDINVSGSIYANNLVGLISSSTQITNLGFTTQSVSLSSLNAFTASYFTDSSSFDSRVLTEKGRIDAILSASTADADTFAEVVALINSVDLTNDTAFASYYTSSNARITSLESATGSYETKGRGIVSGSTQVKNLLPNGTISGSSQLTSSFDTRYTLSGSVQPLPNGLISGSSQLTSSFDTRYTLSGSSSNINTGSFATTGSNNFTGSQTIVGAVTASTAKIANINYPTADGTSGQFVVTNGAGTLTFDDVHVIAEAVRYGENISIGDPLYVSGSNGNNPIVYKADASNPAKMPVIYIASSTNVANTNTTAISLGLITGVTTTGYPAGTEIFVAEGGGWSSNRPSGSNSIVQPLGIVTKEGSGGSGRGLVLNPGPAVLPNLQTGYAWVGNSGNQPTAVATSSFAGTTINTGSFATTGSNTFIGTETISGSLLLSGSFSYNGTPLQNGFAFAQPILTRIVDNSSYTGASSWTGAYTGSGGAIIVTANVSGFKATTGTGTAQLLRDGVAVASQTFYFNIANYHTPITPIVYVRNSETGSHTYSIFFSGISADVNDYATINVLEYGNSAMFPTTIISGSSQLTSSFDTRYEGVGRGVISGSSQLTSSFETKGSGIYSSSAQLPSGLISGSSQLPSGLVSGSSQLTSSYDTRYTLSGSVGATPAGTISGSSQLTSSYDLRYETKGSNIVSGSSQLTSSYDTRYALSSSVSSISSSFNGRFNGLVTTGSNTFSGSQTFSGSVVVTSGQVIASAITNNSSSLYLTSGSNLYVQNNGIVEITGSIIATSITGSIASTNGVISGSSQVSYVGLSNIPASIVSGSSQLTASYDTRYTLSGSVGATPAGTISGSSQLTSSFDTRYAPSASYLTSLNGSGVWSGSAQLPSGVISGSSQLTSSYDVRYALSGSGGSATIPAGTVSGSSQLTSSYDGRYTLTSSFNSFTASAQAVTTGSNSFNGTQTITGSLIITTGSFFASQITANTASLYLTSGSNLYVQNNGLVEITGSMVVSGSTQLTGSISISSGSITMPNRPAFRVIGTGSTNIATPSVLSGSLVSVDYNEGGYYNTTNGKFTAPIAGLYHVFYNGRVGGINASMQVIVYKNTNVSSLMWESVSNTSASHFGVSGILKLAVNDTLEAKVTVGSIQFDANDNWGVAYIG